jgi:alanyl-tRNA synthetase
MIGLDEPFLAEVAKAVIENYSDFYPELERNKAAIFQTLTEEERRFHRTLNIGIAHFDNLIEEMQVHGLKIINGDEAFDLYATYGLPFEITRDLAKEHNYDTDSAGFYEAMEKHRLASSSDTGMMISEDNVGLFRQVLEDLQSSKSLSKDGVDYNPYRLDPIEGKILSLIRDDEQVQSASEGDQVEVVLPQTSFYVEAGGQVTDSGKIVSADHSSWEIQIERAREPVKGLILHTGKVIKGKPKTGDQALALVNTDRRLDIMRNHTATHLLHAALKQVLGEHARQAGSLVAPDRLRFDFTHPEAMTPEEIEKVQGYVSSSILANHKLDVDHKSRSEAIDDGAMALFGETYGEVVRTVSIGEEDRLSYELCGGTHVEETGIIGPFLILSEGSVAAGIRRIEAVTGRTAQSIIDTRLQILEDVAATLETQPEDITSRLQDLITERDRLNKEISKFQSDHAIQLFDSIEPQDYAGVSVLTGIIPDANAEILRELTDRFRTEHSSGVVLLGSVVNERPILVAAVTDDLVSRNLHAGKLVKLASKSIGGGGGGKATLAQAGGSDASKLNEALEVVPDWVKSELK